MKTLIFIRKSIIGQRMILLLIAAFSLIMSGIVLSHEYSLGSMTVQLWTALNGVLIVYGLNSFKYDSIGFIGNLKTYYKSKWNIILSLQLILIGLPLVVFFLPVYCLIVLCISALLGLMYSCGLPMFPPNFRLKKILGLKNLLIGFGWGTLILIGAGNSNNPVVLPFFVFMSLQICVGSAMRDIQDVKSDAISGVNTIPTVIGTDNSLRLFHALNILFFFSFFIFNRTESLLWIFAAVTIWKFINIELLKRNIQSEFWGQTINILCCLFLFILLIINELWVV